VANTLLFGLVRIAALRQTAVNVKYGVDDMPLFFPDDHKPDLSTTSIVGLLCADTQTKRPVQVMVWDQVIEAHAIAAGWKEPLPADYDRKRMVYDVLDGVVRKASETYDEQGHPAVFELQRRL
jgi:hypothetical protein